MATLPFLLIGIWLCNMFQRKCDDVLQHCKEVDKLLNNESKPKYRMKEVSSEDEELFLTDAGDFDEAFRL